MSKFPNCVTFLLLLSIAVGIVATAIFYLLLEPHPVPDVKDEYWGPKSEQNLKQETTIHPFKIDVSNDVLSDLQARLATELKTAATRLPPPLEGTGFEYGFNSNYLSVIGQYWLSQYKWKERQNVLNKFPHFKTKIGGLDIHFQHVKPKKPGKETRPLLIIHGWPGSFVEFQKIIPLLSDSSTSKYNYELVIPSLPGYGFSSPAARPGMSTTEMANIFKRLMLRLGHQKFFVMGGDWGAAITTDMATLYPDNVVAAQSTLCHSYTVVSVIKYALATAFPSVFRSERDRHQEKILSPSNLLSFAIRETGYMHIQSTKPDTIGTGLTHSPLGLAAYILQAFSTATNRAWINREDGGLLEKFTMDELLDNIMIYWVTDSITSAGRLYKEQLNPGKKHQLDRVPTSVPFSCQYLAEEIFVLPEYALEDKYYNIQSYSVESKGGHFGTMEEPELVANNVLQHFDRY